jgi:hypothetical protein
VIGYAVAALLVVGGWACAAALFVVLAQRRHDAVAAGPSHVPQAVPPD